MSERLILQGALSEKKMERMRLASIAQGLIGSIKTIIQPAYITPLAEIRAEEALELIKELVNVKRHYDSLTEEIERIERELGK